VREVLENKFNLINPPRADVAPTGPGVLEKRGATKIPLLTELRVALEAARQQQQRRIRLGHAESEVDALILQSAMHKWRMIVSHKCGCKPIPQSPATVLFNKGGRTPFRFSHLCRCHPIL
jgi:hypothetical protein